MLAGFSAAARVLGRQEKTEMKTKRTSLLMCAAVATAASLAGQVGTLPPPIGEFGLMGGALGQTLRLNVVNPVRAGDVVPLPCHVLAGFKGIRGATLGAVQDLNLAPGQAGFVELNFNNYVSRFGERLQVRPAMAAVNDGSAAGCKASAEMYDQLTGRTMAYASQFLPPPVNDRIPPPIPVFGLLGAAIGQSVRLNVLLPPGPTLPPGPVRVTLGFNIPGFPPGPSRIVDLMPGEGAFLDLPMDGLGLRLGQRIEIRPTIVGATGNLRVTAEVYDQLSGRTTTFVQPPPIND
jgi:hypothetical protein